MLTRDAILAIDDIKTEEVAVPQWGGETVRVKGMTGKERDDFESANRDKTGEQDLRNFRARFLVRVIVNENGTRIFTDQDALALGKKSSAAIATLYTAAARLSGMTEDDAEDAEGNSETEPPTADGSDSLSSSPETSDAPAQNFSPAPVPAS